MPVDMVLAISHNRVMMMERERNRLKRLKNESTQGIVDSLIYDKHSNTDLNVEKNKHKPCLEMFMLLLL
jgi:hypothetical protein